MRKSLSAQPPLRREEPSQNDVPNHTRAVSPNAGSWTLAAVVEQPGSGVQWHCPASAAVRRGEDCHARTGLDRCLYRCLYATRHPTTNLSA